MINYLMTTEAYSGIMLVSRINQRMENAILSMMIRQPEELRLYVDTLKVSEEGVFEKGRELSEVALFKGTLRVFPQTVTDNCPDHHDDVTRNVIRAICEAENEAVLQCDDDDVALIDVSKYLPLMDSKIGIMYGDVVARQGGKTFIRDSKPIHGALEAGNAKGSVCLYNRDAMRNIAGKVDVNRTDITERPPWYGYFYDRQIIYWLLRMGYRTVHINDLWSIQNVNTSHSGKRKKLYGRWEEIVAYNDELDNGNYVESYLSMGED